jgi:hypothetical protein
MLLWPNYHQWDHLTQQQPQPNVQQQRVDSQAWPVEHPAAAAAAAAAAEI